MKKREEKLPYKIYFSLDEVATERMIIISEGFSWLYNFFKRYTSPVFYASFMLMVFFTLYLLGMDELTKNTP